MKLSALLLVIFAISTKVLAQNPYAIKGSVTDTAATYKMVNTAVTILNQKDSTLVSFTRVDADGNFSISNLRKGNFILLVTYPGYADYAEEFALDSIKPFKQFDPINLILRSTLLEDVIIKGKATAIKIKGDTTEYNAGSYNITPNSKVEDLLKQLPGMQIDKDGKITAQGKTVNKVLVDGEEFFGDDPTLVTKNIRADMVDKVQLYDKKSDQATFTGIDDGERAKTINIKLKEDKKSGYFGKADAGGGTDKFYQGQAMLNIFKNKERISAYAITGNTGITGLGWEDAGKYGSASMGMGDGGEMYFSSSGDDFGSWNGRYDGQGIPSARTGGVHYENKWNKDKHAINGNYKLGSVGVEGSKNSLSINNLPGGTIFNNSDQQFNNSMFRQKADATYTYVVDSTSTIKVTASASVGDSKTTDHFTARSVRDSLLLNTDDRILSNDGKQEQFNSSLLWNKKFRKKGRTISVFATQALNRNNTDGYLNAVNEFYSSTGSQPDSIRRTDQYKINKSFGNSLRTNVTYSEPIAKNFSAVINYGLDVNNSSSDRRSFNKSASGSYDVLDTQFSNNFELDQTTNQVGASFNYQQAKTTLNFGTKVSDVKFKQYDVYADKTYQRNFTNWNPQATYRYRFSQQSGIGLTYRGNNSQPGIDQIQPIRVNTDPLNITLGNPDLKPSFTNNFSVDYSTYKILSEQYIYISAYYSFTNNAITNNTVTDDAGKNTFQAVNIKDNTPANFYIYASMERKVKKIDAAVGLEFNSNGYSSFNMVNNELSKTMFGDYYGNIYISKQAAKKYSFRASVGPAYTSMTSSLQSNNSKGWGVDASGNFTVFLPGKVEISSDASYQYKKPTQVFAQNLDRFIWNAAISKKFFKSENLRATLRGNDLMNQNNGFNRGVNGNMITQNSFTTIRRYFLASLTWDFNKMGGATTKN